MRDTLLAAKFALLRCLIKKKLTKNPVEAFADWVVQLERISSSNRETRREGFEKLLVFALRGNEDPVDSSLDPVDAYTRQCDQLARSRLLLEAELSGDPSISIEGGLWCLVFDPVERLRHDSFTSP